MLQRPNLTSDLFWIETVSAIFTVDGRRMLAVCRQRQLGDLPTSGHNLQ